MQWDIVFACLVLLVKNVICVREDFLYFLNILNMRSVVFSLDQN